MGIQINGQTDTVTSTTAGGKVTVTPASFPSVDNLNATGIVTASSFSGALTGNVTGNVNATGVSTFNNAVVGGSTTALVVNGNARITGILTVGQGSITIDGTSGSSSITGVSTIGVGQTIHANSVGVGTNLSDVNNFNYPIIFNTGTYSNQERKPGIVWRSDNNNPTLPKNSIFTREHSGGSELHFASSNNYVTGITTSAYVDQEGRFVSSQSTYACAYPDGSQTRSTSSGWVKIQLSSFFASNVTYDNDNDRFTIIDPGIYHIIGEIQWSASSSGGAWTPQIALYRNGSEDVAHQYLHEVYTSGYSNTIMITRTRPLNEGDYIELYWAQNASSTNTFTNQSHLSIMKVI